MPEMSVFWLTGNGMLSPGRIPPHDLPPSVERMTTICCSGTLPVPSKLQQMYIVPILPSRGALGPPLASVWLSTAIQFLSSRNSRVVSGLTRLSCTVVGPVHGWPGRLVCTVMLKPWKAFVPPGASSTLA
jgi:hypothetical protein